MQRGPVTPKGFGDIYPKEAAKRRRMFNAVIPILEQYGFQPLETPIVEFAETLLGKYGEDEKLIYQFEDKGGRKLALRYDLTVPLARFVANNLGLLNPTFGRYQIGQVFRGENPQKGRRREFTQFDFDTVGVGDKQLEYEDAKIISAAIESARNMGLNEAIMLINDRRRFNDIPIEVIRIFDKLPKIGMGRVEKELKERGYENKIEDYKFRFTEGKKMAMLDPVFNILKNEFNKIENKDFAFEPSLARGLDYYTSTVMELKLDKTPGGLSIGGGGRYDNLIGMFAGKTIPAVGFSFGIDRIIDLLS